MPVFTEPELFPRSLRGRKKTALRPGLFRARVGRGSDAGAFSESRSEGRTEQAGTEGPCTGTGPATAVPVFGQMRISDMGGGGHGAARMPARFLRVRLMRHMGGSDGGSAGGKRKPDGKCRRKVRPGRARHPAVSGPGQAEKAQRPGRPRGGRAASRAEPTAKIPASSKARPMSCNPTGRPEEPRQAGMERLGSPARFTGQV